jgi:hypothetical protein
MSACRAPETSRLPSVAARTPTGIEPALTISGTVTGAAFTAYAQWVLAPSLRPGQVLVLHILSAA